MRAVSLTLFALLLVPAAVAATDHDDASDERMRIPVATSSVEPRAADAGCDAPGVDLLSLETDLAGNTVIFRMTVRDVLAAPTCAGRALETAYSNYDLDLESEAWTVSAIGGTACSGQWSCIRLIKHGAGSFFETVPGATGVLSGDTWSVRMPLHGATSTGKPFDLRGEDYRLHAGAQQKHSQTALTFFDTASASVSLR